MRERTQSCRYFGDDALVTVIPIVTGISVEVTQIITDENFYVCSLQALKVTNETGIVSPRETRGTIEEFRSTTVAWNV